MKLLRENMGNPLGIRLTDKAKKMPVVDTSGRFKTKNKKHNAKITKNWNIEDFEISMLYVQLSWHPLPMGQTGQLQLSRPCFEQWLAENGKLDWHMEEHDGYGGLQLLKGTMAVDDYWENAEYEVKRKDLKDYVMAGQLLTDTKKVTN